MSLQCKGDVMIKSVVEKGREVNEIKYTLFCLPLGHQSLYHSPIPNTDPTKLCSHNSEVK